MTIIKKWSMKLYGRFFEPNNFDHHGWRSHYRAFSGRARSQPEEEMSIWRRCYPLIPHRTVTGTWTNPYGRIWRRKRNERWEYREDEETEQEWLDRQW